MKERVVVLIDGFNIYHALDRSCPKSYKWCDLRKLMDQFIDPQKQKISEVIYFSAYCTWSLEKMKRHKTYVKALLSVGVTIILGNFQKIRNNCDLKKMFITKISPSFLRYFSFLLPKYIQYQTYEEKETDVNIAIKIVEYAFLDKYDRAIIVSGDSDLTGAIKTVKRNFPQIKFTSLLPPKAKGKKYKEFVMRPNKYQNTILLKVFCQKKFNLEVRCYLFQKNINNYSFINL